MPMPDRDRGTDPPETRAARGASRTAGAASTGPVAGAARAPLAEDEVYALQRAAGNRAVGGLLDGHAPAPPVAVQRVLVVGGRTYGASDAERLTADYDDTARVALRDAIRASTRPLDTVEAALGSNSEYWLRAVGQGFVVDDIAVPIAPPGGGGLVWNTTARPRAVRRPGNGYVGLRFHGLISCLGILAEASAGEDVVIASGFHFVTPDLVVGQALSPAGRAAIDAMLAQVAGQGTLSVRLLRQAASAAPSGHVPADQRDSAAAAELVTEYLGTRQVSDVRTRDGGGTANYELWDDGSSQIG